MQVLRFNQFWGIILNWTTKALKVTWIIWEVEEKATITDHTAKIWFKYFKDGEFI